MRHLNNRLGFLVLAGVLLFAACAPASTPATSEPSKVAGVDWRTDWDGFVKAISAKPDRDTRPAKRGGTFVYPASSDPPHFDPAQTISWPAHAQWTLGYNRLLAMKTGIDGHPFKWELGSDLAEKWDISPDGKVFTITMRQGVKWHNKPPLDGRELTSTDVKYSYERYMTHPQSVQKSTFDEVDKIETPDKYTLKITLKAASAGFLNKLGSLFPYIVAKELVEEKGDLKLSLVGTGPFIFDGWERGVQVNWKRNPDYFEKGDDGKSLPYLDGLIFRIIPDASTRLAAFRAKQVDVGSASTPSELKPILESVPDMGIQLGPAPFAVHLSGQLNQKPWSDVRFRRAVSLALNRQRMLDSVFEGNAHIQSTGLPWAMLYDTPAQARTPEALGKWHQLTPDLDAAKKLMAEGGYTNVKMKLYNTPQYGATFAGVAAAAKEDLAKIGIELTITETDYTKFYTAMYLQGNWDDLMLSHLGNQGNDVDEYTWGLTHKGSSRNFWHIDDSEMDKLTDAQRVEMDPKKRMDIVKKIQDRWSDQVYQAWVPYANAFVVWHKHVVNYRQNPNTGTGFSFGPSMRYVWLDK